MAELKRASEGDTMINATSSLDSTERDARTAAQADVEASRSARVFALPELMEAILLNVPIKDILLDANRVCSHWNATIKDSVSLQRALFFSPLQVKVAERLRKTYDERAAKGYCVAHAPYVVENPFYIVLMDQGGPWGRTSRQRLDVYHRKDASWRRMLICRPPIDFTTATYQRSHGGGLTITIDGRNGVTFGDIEAAGRQGMPKSRNFSQSHPLYISGQCFVHLPEVKNSEQWESVQVACEVKRIAQGNTAGAVRGTFTQYG